MLGTCQPHLHMTLASKSGETSSATELWATGITYPVLSGDRKNWELSAKVQAAESSQMIRPTEHHLEQRRRSRAHPGPRCFLRDPTVTTHAWLSDSSLNGTCTTPTWTIWLAYDHYLNRLFMTPTVTALYVHDPYMTRVRMAHVVQYRYSSVHDSCLRVHYHTCTAPCLTPISMSAVWLTCTLFVSDSPMHDAYLTLMPMIHVLLACAWLLTELPLRDSLSELTYVCMTLFPT